MKQVHLIISGNVQGVGFRAWMKREALALGLSGWVKNREDGAVEAVIEGNNEAIDQMITVCQRGPEVARVQNVQINEVEQGHEYITFEIKK